jgi:glycosyltransferase involved in cell wall biosynthesis
MNPRVSVVMSVFNGEKYLRNAVESILSQTFADFEFIVIDDGSSDRGSEVIKAYKDPRIRFSCNEQNMGLTRTLNMGLKQARGEYIARMDCDDVSLPDRLTRQVAFMDSNPNMGACCTWALDIDETGKVIGRRETPIGEKLDNFYWQGTPLIHPAAMFRFKQSCGPWYDETMRFAQDYELWLRIRAEQRLGALTEYLLLYRVHDKSITAANPEEQTRSSYIAFCKHIGGNKISYGEFMALLNYSNRLDPFRRALAMRRLAKNIRKPYRVFFNDDIQYARRWLYSRRIYRLAFGTQGFRAFCNSIMRTGLHRTSWW